jgi:hypothetical protein
VTFHGASASFEVNLDTEIVATVPVGATSGPIAVTTPGGSGTSLTDFTVLPPTPHARSVSLRLRRNLVPRGRVVASGGFGACEMNALVKIQRRGPKGWRGVAHDVTSGKARHRERLSDRAGRYRTVVPRKIVNGGQDVCRRDVSPIRRHP